MNIDRSTLASPGVLSMRAMTFPWRSNLQLAPGDRSPRPPPGAYRNGKSRSRSRTLRPPASSRFSRRSFLAHATPHGRRGQRDCSSSDAHAATMARPIRTHEADRPHRRHRTRFVQGFARCAERMRCHCGRLASRVAECGSAPKADGRRRRRNAGRSARRSRRCRYARMARRARGWWCARARGMGRAAEQRCAHGGGRGGAGRRHHRLGRHAGPGDGAVDARRRRADASAARYGHSKIHDRPRRQQHE